MDTPSELYARWFKIFAESAPAPFLKHGYQTGEVSGMAASLESILTFLSEVQPGDVILDAGAGASTWMFNHLAQDCRVISIDPDPAYLAVTATVVRTFGAGDCEIQMEAGFPHCDYCFFDYGSALERAKLLPEVASVTRKALYVDDYDHRELSQDYRSKVDAFSQTYGYLLKYCPKALDSYGRAGAWIHLQ
jgi:hypothetical protein